MLSILYVNLLYLSKENPFEIAKPPGIGVPNGFTWIFSYQIAPVMINTA
nr:MAG TPA: hypothetical protein [Caudoviricetes sp.]